MSRNTKSLIGGMTVLGITGIVCKLIGVLYSIPLTWAIGLDGQGIFQTVYPTYTLLLTISSAGLPVAVSRMVSQCLAKKDPHNAHHVFKVALVLLSALGVLSSLIMFIAAPLLSSKQPLAQPGFYVIAPCVTVVCILSAFRGFMQGQQNMVPTAVSQLIEQIGKVCLSLPLAYLGAQKSVADGAVGALLGITFVEAIALLYMMLVYTRKKKEFSALPQETSEKPQSASTLMMRLLRISIPITVSACIVPLATFIDSQMLVERLMAAGLTIEEASPLYGLFSGIIIRLINIPTALALSISMSLVPAISAAAALKSEKAVRDQSDFGLRFAFIIGFPCAVGMSLLSKNLLLFFYKGTLAGYAPIQGTSVTDIAAGLLAMQSLTVVLFTSVQATSAILQGVGKQRIPMYTLIAGVICKIILNYTLVALPGLNIHGAPIASLVCYFVSLVPNLLYCLKYAHMPFNFKGWLLRPALATACMGLVVILLQRLLPINHLTTLLEVAIGVIVYIGAAFLLKAIRKDDFSSLRGRKVS